MVRQRKTRDLCQQCWQDDNPGDYFPDGVRYGDCAECGDHGLVSRSRIWPDTIVTCAGFSSNGYLPEPTCQRPMLP